MIKNTKKQGIYKKKASYKAHTATITLLVILGVIFFMPNISATYPDFDGLIAYWTFNESTGDTISDETGYVSNSTIQSYSADRWVTGISGTALNFTNGANGNVSVANESYFDSVFNGREPFSTCFVVNTNGTVVPRGILSKGRGTQDLAIVINPDNTLRFLFWLGRSIGAQTVNPIPIKTNVFSCVTYDGSTNSTTGVKWYVDGTLQDMTFTDGVVTPGYNLSDDYNVTIGSYDPNYDFDGWIDEMGIWNKTLSANEVLIIYNDSSILKYPFAPQDIYILSQSFNASVFELSTQNFTINITHNDSVWTSITGTLYYNGTGYAGTKSGSGEDLTFSRSIQIPTIEYQGNKTFFWNFTLTNGGDFYYNSTEQQQEVNFSTPYSQSHAFNSSVFETATENFTINISYYAPAYTNIVGTLYYNGTAYSTSQSGTGDDLTFSSSLDIPLISYQGNRTFLWNFALTNATGITYWNSTEQQQEVNFTNLIRCNTTYTTAYMNFTFEDEGDNSAMTASIPTSTFLYYLGSGAINKTLTFVDNVENSSFAFCLSAENTPVNIDLILQYKNSTAPQRTYDPPLTTFTNATTNTTLFLLSEDDGIYVTFQVINPSEQPIEGVVVNASRTIGGEIELVGEGTTGADGAITFWLNPDFSHTLSFVASGYQSYTTSITPTQNQYTITLGQQGTSARDYTRGIKTYINPKANELANDTSYTFSFNVTSSYWDLDSFGFSLRLSNGTIVGTPSSVTSGSPAEFDYDVNNQTIIYMDYYWIIEGNRTDGTRYWIIESDEYTSSSIKNFFTDLKTYLDAGLFGIDNFGRYLIVFIILFGSVGIMSYKFGLTSPMSVTAMIFAIVFFFDVVVGILPDIRGISNLPTYLAGILLVGTIVREVTR